MDELGGDPPEEVRGLHWHDREPCLFTREEGEAYGTYVACDMSRIEGDDSSSGRATAPIGPGVFVSAT